MKNKLKFLTISSALLLSSVAFANTQVNINFSPTALPKGSQVTQLINQTPVYTSTTKKALKAINASNANELVIPSNISGCLNPTLCELFKTGQNNTYQFTFTPPQGKKTIFKLSFYINGDGSITNIQGANQICNLSTGSCSTGK